MWETAEGLAWLRYCSEHPDMAAVAVHEYSLSASDIRSGYPWLVGRHQFVLDVCDEHGIPYPPFLICEFGWTYKDMPGPEEALRQLTEPDGDDPAIVDVYGDIPIALWTLGRWDNGEDLPPKMAATIPAVTDWMLANSEPDEPEPPPDPGLWYKSIVVLAPQTYTLEQMLELRRAEYANRRTITQSHDEALQLRQLGQPGSYTIVYDIERWEPEIQAALTAGEHELRSLEPEAPVDFGFAAWPTNYLYVTQLFGANPQNYDEYGLPGHEGVDIRAYSGTPIYAVAHGRVTWAGDGGGAYGIYVIVDHGDGWSTAYAHCESVLVSAGETVTAGQQIARADNTGNSDGSHLHISLKRAGHTYVDARGVTWPRNYHDPTPYLQPFGAQWPGLPLPPDYIDILPYIKGDGTLYEVRHETGGQERFQTQTGPGNVFYQTKNAGWEMFVYDDTYIWRGKDTTPGPAPDYAERPGAHRYYVQREPGYERARWCRRYMRVGETYVGPEHHVQFYYKSDCSQSAANSGNARNAITLTGTYRNRTWNGITVNDVISMTNGAETWYFARGFGLVAWRSPWGESAISEIHAPGSRPDNQREVIPCL